MENNKGLFNFLLHLNENSYKNKTIFAFNKKEDIKKGSGVCFPNTEHFLADRKDFSHWTPNFFRSGFYNENGYLLGHRESNLAVINALVVDVDSKKSDYFEILKKAGSLNLSPSMILDTPNGFHLYYILKSSLTASYLDDVKKISILLREKLSLKIENIDHGCNHFGIFRFPTEKNILFLEKSNTYTFENLLSLLKHESEEIDFSSCYKTTSSIAQVNTGWFNLLSSVKKTEIKKEGCGRNNLLFTLALGCFSTGLSLAQATKKLRIFNSNLKMPLDQREFIKTVSSAYSGRYKGASNFHITRLLKTYKPNQPITKALFWHKKKKNRLKRKNSYLYEWEADFINWIEENTNIENPKINLTLSEFSEKTNIPKSSLKILLNQLKIKNKINVNSKKGRYGYTVILYLPNLIKKMVKLKNERIKNYLEYKNIIIEFLRASSLEKNTLTQGNSKNEIKRSG